MEICENSSNAAKSKMLFGMLAAIFQGFLQRHTKMRHQLSHEAAPGSDRRHTLNRGSCWNIRKS
jgi:hypothetical protein